MRRLIDSHSLRFRVLLLAAVTIGATLVVAGVSVKLLFERHIQRRLAAELETRIVDLAGSIAVDPEGKVAVTRPPADLRYNELLSGAYWQISAGDLVLEHSRSLWDQTLPVPETGASDKPYEAAVEDGAELYLLARPLKIGEGAASRELTLVVALDHRELEALTDAFGSELNLALAAIALVLFGGAFVQMNVGLAPLRRLHGAVQSIRSGKTQRLGGEFSSEVMPLAEDLNRLIDRHEALLQSARDRAGTLAHGFKTPLTILGLEAGKLEAQGQRTFARVLREQIETMRRHVEQELARARIRGTTVADSALGAGAGTDLASDTARLVDLVRRMPLSDRLVFSLEVPDGLSLRMDRHDFGEVLGNLLDNARKWARSAVIVKAASTDADTVLLEVIDDGPGFEPAASDQNARNADGSGLGLRIVQDVLDAYGTSLQIARRDGRTVVSVKLRSKAMSSVASASPVRHLESATRTRGHA